MSNWIARQIFEARFKTKWMPFMDQKGTLLESIGSGVGPVFQFRTGDNKVEVYPQGSKFAKYVSWESVGFQLEAVDEQGRAEAFGKSFFSDIESVLPSLSYVRAGFRSVGLYQVSGGQAALKQRFIERYFHADVESDVSAQSTITDVSITQEFRFENGLQGRLTAGVCKKDEAVSRFFGGAEQNYSRYTKDYGLLVDLDVYSNSEFESEVTQLTEKITELSKASDEFVKNYIASF